MSKKEDNSIRLTAGPLTADFFPDEVLLRSVCAQNVEALRGVYIALRDRNWSTVAPTSITVTSQTIEEHSFRLALAATWSGETVQYEGACELTGTVDGKITFSFEGKAQSEFLKNRIGFVVLHGAQLAGQAVEVEQVDGSIEHSVFPEMISPHQPFFDVRAIKHEFAPGCFLQSAYQGDTFEMEDQRNWTDASYKTYCTPLGNPFPVLIRQGDKVQQSVTLELVCDRRLELNDSSATSRAIKLRPLQGADPVKLPRIGLEKEWGDQLPYSESELGFLRSLNLGHLRAEARFAHEDWETEIESGIALAKQLGVALELAVFLCDGCEGLFGKLIDQVNDASVAVNQWLILHETEPVPPENATQLAANAIQASGLDGLVAAGTNANFAELNREAPNPGPFDALCYAINPQVHAFDDLSLIETLPMHAVTSRSAQGLRGSLASIISPITLTQRYNPVATSTDRPFSYNETPDPRQKTAFGSVWTAGSLLHAALGGTYSATYFKTRGSAGVMKENAKTETDLYPLYSVVRYFCSLEGAALHPIKSEQANSVDAVVIENGDTHSYLIINYTESEQEIDLLPDPGFGVPKQMRPIGGGVSRQLPEPGIEGTLHFSVPARSIFSLFR